MFFLWFPYDFPMSFWCARNHCGLHLHHRAHHTSADSRGCDRCLNRHCCTRCLCALSRSFDGKFYDHRIMQRVDNRGNFKKISRLRLLGVGGCRLPNVIASCLDRTTDCILQPMKLVARWIRIPNNWIAPGDGCRGREGFHVFQGLLMFE